MALMTRYLESISSGRLRLLVGQRSAMVFNHASRQYESVTHSIANV